jgi:hypothetical protein
MELTIFDKAQSLLSKGLVKLDNETDKSMYFTINGHSTYIKRDATGTILFCDCKCGSLKMDCLCSHKVAVILYVAQMKK